MLRKIGGGVFVDDGSFQGDAREVLVVFLTLPIPLCTGYFHFDSCQMPLNVLDYNFRSFAHQVVPRLVAEKTAVLGMKPLANGLIFQLNGVNAIDCLHYSLNLPTSVVINGCDSQERLEQAFQAMKTFRPMDEAQVEALTAKTKQAALSGRIERFKTSEDFDGTSHNPASMG